MISKTKNFLTIDKKSNFKKFSINNLHFISYKRNIGKKLNVMINRIIINYPKNNISNSINFFSKQENYSNPADKFILKKIFYYESGKEIFKGFINSFLEEKEKIKNLFQITPVLEPLKIDGKKYAFDLSFKNEKDQYVCCLIQNHYEENFLNKCYYYAARRQIYELDYEVNLAKIRPVILLSVLNFNLFPEHKNHISIFEFGCKENYSKLQNLKMIFIELPKFHLDVNDKRGFEWCKYLTYGDQKETYDKNVKYAQKIYRFYNRIE